MNSRYIDSQEASQISGKGVNQIYTWIQQAQFVVVRRKDIPSRNGSRLYIDKESFQEFLDKKEKV